MTIVPLFSGVVFVDRVGGLDLRSLYAIINFLFKVKRVSSSVVGQILSVGSNSGQVSKCSNSVGSAP